jgi:class 3 adenylate cyclase
MDPKELATQMLRFSILALKSINKFNKEYGINIAVRIIINTSGSIIGGLLGTKNPLLDIIGDAINVADRLKSTDQPRLVQINESTYKLVMDQI